MKKLKNRTRGRKMWECKMEGARREVSLGPKDDEWPREADPEED